ncbi:tripartite tricarboxylate transporter substrate binding protein [Roseiarcaceae bacterium H3SJ34-1]|nr:tripartite tricarboxylate transporter substrate binding protein [Roseiarcaceae bacterium H3SJ34-1]
MMKRYWRTGLLAALTVAAGTGGPAWAQQFPSGNVRFIVNVNAGGVTDTLARVVGQGLNELWGKPVIVENRAGGNSAIAAQAVLREPPDGHTLLVTADNTFTANPFMVKDLNYRVEDFVPIFIICRSTPVLVVNKSVPATTVKEFIELARQKPGTLNYGSQGPGSYAHLGMEDFKRRTGTELVHVPYRGGAPQVEGLLRGDVSSIIVNFSSAEPYEESGMRILAVAGDKRYSGRPELPTVAESVPGYSVSTWFGIFGPAKLPGETVQKLQDGIRTVLDTPKSKEFFARNSCERTDLSSSEMAKLIVEDGKHWGGLIRSAGIKVE